MYKIEVEEILNLPVEGVFEKVVDHENYQDFPGIDQSILLEQGTKSKNGEGAYRRIKSGLFSLEEKITLFEPPYKMEYRIVKSFPIRIDHILGRISLEPINEKTKVVWVSQFEVRTPLFGKAIENRLGPLLTKSFSRILRYIEKQQS